MTNAALRKKKPVVALMGEFSAGKSTLANMLIGQGKSPVKVTATQLPPVWFSYGADAAYTVDLAGKKAPLDLADLETVQVSDTAYVKIFMQADILEMMDLIDLPGNSDPNMSPEVWQRAIHHADTVIWCSHATQAWRQTEAAAWAELPRHLYPVSILLLTRFDKLLNDHDRGRVLARVRAETRGQFRDVFPVSLIQAVEAGDDHDAWLASGAAEFVQCLLDTVIELDALPNNRSNVLPLRQTTEPVSPLRATPTPRPTASEQPDATSGAIAPKRVERPAGEARERPPAKDGGLRRPVA
ncbi:MAG: dynamin family protein [Alphaproteobacteria bacterium]|nr:dynamin family protein [Alphaproteobacteria bacterium]